MARSTFRKEQSGAPEGFFEAEAAGLHWLAAASAQGGVAVVGVIDDGPGFIELQRIELAEPSRAAAETFGRALAATHVAGAADFGSRPDGWGGPCYIGRQALPMHCHDNWGEFYAIDRLQPYLREAERIGTIDADGYRAVQSVCDRLTARDFDDGVPPARIHGDLWAGNLLFAGDGAVLIDPAAHGGHPITDLAMLALFGAPHLPLILASYAEAAGLDRCWDELIGLHQLHPLLVHAVTHGPSYGAEAARVARRYR